MSERFVLFSTLAYSQWILSMPASIASIKHKLSKAYEVNSKIKLLITMSAIVKLSDFWKLPCFTVLFLVYFDSIFQTTETVIFQNEAAVDIS